MILDFTLLFSAARSVQVLPAVPVIIEALKVTVKRILKRLKGALQLTQMSDSLVLILILNLSIDINIKLRVNYVMCHDWRKIGLWQFGALLTL